MEKFTQKLLQRVLDWINAHNKIAFFFLHKQPKRNRYFFSSSSFLSFTHILLILSHSSTFKAPRALQKNFFSSSFIYLEKYQDRPQIYLSHSRFDVIKISTTIISLSLLNLALSLSLLTYYILSAVYVCLIFEAKIYIFD